MSATKKQIETILKKELSKSKRMIELYELGLEIKTISDLFTELEGKLVRYNFVYNVVSNHCNMNGLTITTTKKEGKSDKIIEMYLQNKTTKEISIELKTPSNYVYNTIKKYKLENNVDQTVNVTNETASN